MLRKKTDETDAAFADRLAALVTVEVPEDLVEAIMDEVRDSLENGQVLTAMEQLMEAGIGFYPAGSPSQRHAISEMIKGAISARTAAKALTADADAEIKAAQKEAAEKAKAAILARRATVTAAPAAQVESDEDEVEETEENEEDDLFGEVG